MHMYVYGISVDRFRSGLVSLIAVGGDAHHGGLLRADYE